MLVAPNNAPTSLNHAFLQSRGIVPAEWAPVGQPIMTEVVSQLEYATGVRIIATPDRIMLHERVPEGFVGGEQSLPLWLSEIAARYLETLSFLHCVAVGVNLSAVVRATDGRGFTVLDRFVAEGPWKMTGDFAPQASVGLVYPRPDRGVLGITLQDVTDGTGHPAIAITTNCHHDLADPSVPGMIPNVECATPIVRNAPADIGTTLTLINENLLAQESIR